MPPETARGGGLRQEALVGNELSITDLVVQSLGDLTMNAAGGAAAQAAISQAIKACGVLVQVDPEEFQRIMDRQKEPLVVCGEGGFLTTTYRYLCTYRGLCFYAQSNSPIHIPTNAEVIVANKIWIPI
jgi:hypothetical protein